MGRYIKNYSKYCFVTICLNLSVFVLVGANSKCATLYSSSSYQGNPVSLVDGAKLPNLPYKNYVPQSVRVTSGCFLTILDVYGNRQTLDKDNNNLRRSMYNVLDAACCECGGCSGASDKLNGLQCARLFENARCDSCSGYRLDLNIGDQARNFGPLNNKMTSIAVRSGCTLTTFSEFEFQGWRSNFTTSSNLMGDNWYKQISSAKCGCGYLAIDPPTFPSGAPVTMSTVPTRAPITLPTVPTRAPITLPTVPTRAPITLPTVSTKAPITLPTVPTRAPITLPTVPTYPPYTLPTVPTTSSRPPITLPTVPTTKPPITLPTVPTTTQTTTTTTEGFDYYPGGRDSLEKFGDLIEPSTTETPESESEEPEEEEEEEEEESSEWW